jgi:hypothetical protein
MAAGRGTPVATELRSWDGVWMLSIAQHGYDGVPVTLVDAFGRHTADTPYAFFPGYPATIAAVGVLTGGNLVVAALLVTTPGRGGGGLRAGPARRADARRVAPGRAAARRACSRRPRWAWS